MLFASGSLDELSDTEREKWKSELGYYIRKLSLKYNKPLMLKSPAHTARIELLLDLFPDAKFINIHRHPYSVVRSGISWLKKTRVFWSLQKSDNTDVVDVFLRNYQTVVDSYFEQRHLIPENRLIEIGHEELENSPIRQLSRIYKTLELPCFASVEGKFEDYLASVRNYKKNEFKPLPEALQERIVKACPDAFDLWGYETGFERYERRAA